MTLDSWPAWRAQSREKRALRGGGEGGHVALQGLWVAQAGTHHHTRQLSIKCMNQPAGKEKARTHTQGKRGHEAGGAAANAGTTD